MKVRQIAAIVALLSAPYYAQACLADGGVDGAIFASPAGTFEVAVAFHQAQKQGEISRSNQANWLTVQFLLMQKLQAGYSNQVFDVTLFDMAGQHFYRLIGDGKQVRLLPHEIPNKDYAEVVVTDVDVLTAMVRGKLSFSQAQTLGVVFNAEVSTPFEHLMQKSFS
ncbi:hypothetical protein [Motilimonas pumila]|uniref:SCP2 domain-containing protein n=1 Tax=Motilimonas pumila TaxID=2303987 RepID=A0A418YHL6_9GAMM|nr:hypothetical protein [Motilimonas pumila]RJG49890.1 hypothetical protein D1Z90_04395 [Motilimonas pumila]